MRDFEITKREVLASVSIVAVMLLIGVLIAGKISDYQLDKNEIYNKAVKIETADMFEYGMRTNVGNAFVYGELKAVDTVTYPEIGGGYMYIEKVKERYTPHTRQVAHTRTVNGKTTTYYTTETYWTWDRVGHDDKKCETITLLGVALGSDKIETPSSSYVTTIKESSHVRYKYYGVADSHIGTIFTDLRDDTISDRSAFYVNMNTSETLERLTADYSTRIFWVCWIFLIAFSVWGFYYIDNRWLE